MAASTESITISDVRTSIKSQEEGSRQRSPGRTREGRAGSGGVIAAGTLGATVACGDREFSVRRDPRSSPIIRSQKTVGTDDGRHRHRLTENLGGLTQRELPIEFEPCHGPVGPGLLNTVKRLAPVAADLRIGDRPRE